jgi:hypothetical protein
VCVVILTPSSLHLNEEVELLAQVYSHLNNFIDGNIIFYLPFYDRNFTWFRGDGVSTSRLDRFLLSDAWRCRWPHMIHRALMRGLSDHCPILSYKEEENWGPRPRRMLKCWAN